MKPSRLLIALLILLAIALPALGQGIIFPRPCSRPEVRCPPPPPPPQIPQHPLKVKRIQIHTKITDQAAVTHVVQVFENDTPFVLEGVYFFPLPDNVSITEFVMWDGDKRLVGEARSREEARRIYDDIVRSRRDPALLEYAGKNLFQASIFPIAPHSDKKIELTYSQVLSNEGGTVSYRYPLGTGWRAAGWNDPMPRPVPMREDWRPGGPPRNPPPPASAVIAASVEIASRVAIKSVYSPSHEIDLRRDGERKARLSFETRAGTAHQDFQLYYSLSDQDFGMSLLTHREPGKDGYFMLLVSPKAELDEKEVLAKEVVFVLDTSGSMSDMGKMEAAKKALRHGVSTLGARDRFNIVSFAGEEHLLAEGLLAGDGAGKKQALEFIEKMKPTGGTNINDALLAAFKQLQASERPQLVVLITDGQPTVGETQASRILANAKQSNSVKARLFTFGVGYDVNTLLLDGLANEHRGAVAYIEPNENIEVKVSNFFSKVNHPVLSDLRIDWGGVQADLIYPREMPDLFHGSQLALIGRYRTSKRAAAATQRPGNSFAPAAAGAETKVRLTLTGKVNSRDRRFVFEDVNFPDTQREHDFLPHLWAMRRVGHLLDQIRLNGESKEVRDEIVELGTRFGIVTPYTSYLVLEPGMRVAGGVGAGRGDGPRKYTPGSMNETVMVTPSARPVAGQDAVLASKEKEELRKADKIIAADWPNNPIRQVAGKTFYLRDGVWTDSEFKADTKLPVVSLKFASDEYFTLLGKDAKLADWFALGKSVVVVWNGKVYRVTE
jgi:Ca-activated chloride channel family protein